MATVLLYDGNWVAFKSFMSSRMATMDGTDTSVAFGMFRDMKTYVPITGAQSAAVLWDARNGTARRKKIYPQYKAPRKKAREKAQFDYEAFNGSVSTAKKMLKKLNIPSLTVNGYEGDDLLGFLSGALERHGHKVVIRSSDKDMYQLVNKNISIQKDEDTRITPRFFRDQGINAKAWILERAIIGDTSDNVKGVDGVGEKRARAVITELLKHDTDPLEALRTASIPDDLPVSKYIKKIRADFMPIISRNMKLMTLNKKKTGKKIERLADRLGCRWGCERSDAWEAFCAVEFRQALTSLPKDDVLKGFDQLFGTDQGGLF